MSEHPGIKVALAKTCFWAESEDPGLADIAGRQAIVWVARDRDGTESFETGFGGTSAFDASRVPVAAGPELGPVIADLNDRLSALERTGAQPHDAGPTRIDPTSVAAKLPSTREFIDQEAERWRNVPPPTPEVDPVKKAELLRIAFEVLSKGKGTDDELEAATLDAADAIRNLPCDGCGGIHWPVVAQPEMGTSDWWDSPGAYFACRTCGRYLADGFAYPYIRQPSDRYPLEGVLPSEEERRARREAELSDR